MGIWLLSRRCDGKLFLYTQPSWPYAHPPVLSKVNETFYWFHITLIDVLSEDVCEINITYLSNFFQPGAVESTLKSYFFFLFWILFCFILIEVSRKIIFLHSKMHDSGFQLWVTAANRNAKFIIHSLRRNYRNSLACICNSDVTVYLSVISSFTFDSLVLLIKFLDCICLYYAN